MFLVFAKENRKYVANIKRTYYSVISDALEGGFAFDLETDSYAIDFRMLSYDDAVVQAVEIEEKIVAFYTDAAEQSMVLMADIPRQFKIIAKKKQKRIDQLRSLII